MLKKIIKVKKKSEINPTQSTSILIYERWYNQLSQVYINDVLSFKSKKCF